MKRIIFLMIAAVILAACQKGESLSAGFVKVDNGHFVRDGKPYYYVGTNFWYGAILGSEGQGGDRERLARELDEMKRIGIDNLRILVGSDGERGYKTKVEPTLQIAPGVYNDTILAGLDRRLRFLFGTRRRGQAAAPRRCWLSRIYGGDVQVRHQREGASVVL